MTLKNFTLISMALFAVLCLTAAAIAGVPDAINYQGRLTDNAGLPLTGTHTLTIGLYSSEAGGSPVFSATLNSVTFTPNGEFSVMLSPVDSTTFTSASMYIELKVDGNPPMPRYRVLSVPYAHQSSHAYESDRALGLPQYSIVMWYGNPASIPAGWQVCNGTNGTPDLTDRVAIGAGNAYALNATGGEAAHTLTQGEMPGHNHYLMWSTAQPAGVDGIATTPDGVRLQMPPPPWLIGHDYTIGLTETAGGNSAHNNLPPYTGVYFICKYN